jgi:hypothetical protein
LLLAAACAGSEPLATSTAGAAAESAAAPVALALEQPFHPTADDWEPTVAADPLAPYVYLLTTRYGGRPACPRGCPDPAIILRVSSDGGATFGPESYICACRDIGAQNDPEIAVAADGTVYAAWLNDFVPGVVFSKSRDHGRSWTAPVRVMGTLPWSDKPWLTVSASGRDVYIAFNTSNSYIVASHDAGATFGEPVRTNRDDRYYYANGGFVAPSGVVTFSEASYAQSNTGPVSIHTMRSADGGRSWHTTLVDVVQEQPACISEGCPAEFYGPADALGGDASGGLVLAYNGALVPQGPQRIFVRRSGDGGASWSPRMDISGAPAGANGAFPAAAGGGSGDFRIWYMDDRNGPAGWNAWFRRSRDGGQTWSAEARLSNAPSGAPYKSAAGFAQPYGDYGGLAVTSSGASFAVWGEGRSYNGPGGSWFNRTGAPAATEPLLAALDRTSGTGPGGR